MYKKLLFVVILIPDILLCFNLSGTIYLNSDFLKRIAVPPLKYCQTFVNTVVYDVKTNYSRLINSITNSYLCCVLNDQSFDGQKICKLFFIFSANNFKIIRPRNFFLQNKLNYT